MKNLKTKILVAALSSFWLFTLMNPVFKKYDYGAGWPMVILLCVLCLAVVWLVRGDRIGWSKLIRNEQIYILGFLVFAFLSFVFSEVRTAGLPELLAYFGVFGVYLALAYRENKWMAGFLKVVAIGAVLASLFGFFIYFFQTAPPRMIGPFFNIFYHSHLWPNAFASFLVMAWPLVLLFLGESDDERVGRLWQASLILVLSALLLTYSRGAIIVFAVQLMMLVAYFFVRIGLKKRGLMNMVGKSYVVVMGVTLLVFGSHFARSQIYEDSVSVSEKIAFENQEVYTSVQERYDFWAGALALTFDSPLVGHGPYSFRYLYAAEEQKDLLAIADHPHNVFLKIGAENGLVAMIAFVLFLFSVLYAWIRSYVNFSEEGRALSFILGVSIAGGIAHNLVDYNFNFLANLLLLFMLLAFFRSLCVQNFYTAKAAGEKSRFPAVFRWVVGVFVFVFTVYEGGLLVISNTIDEDARSFSFYPRNYYLDLADEALAEGEFEDVEKFALEHLELTPYEGQAWYLMGSSYFSAVNPAFDEVKAAEYFHKAIEVNPYNDLTYHREYLSALISFGDEADILALKDELLELLADYEVLIAYNVHFTTYTPNADAAVDIYKILAMYFPEPESDAVPYDHMFGEGNVSQELLDKAELLQDVIDEIRARRKL